MDLKDVLLSEFIKLAIRSTGGINQLLFRQNDYLYELEFGKMDDFIHQTEIIMINDTKLPLSEVSEFGQNDMTILSVKNLYY